MGGNGRFPFSVSHITPSRLKEETSLQRNLGFAQQNLPGKKTTNTNPTPNKPEETIPGKSWFVIIRMYAPLNPWIDQTWRPGEVELID